MAPIGKLFIAAGILLVIIGILLLAAPKIPFLGKLPGDIIIKKERFTFYFPVVSSIVVSIILSLLFWIFRSK